MFSHASVILSMMGGVRGGGHVWQRGHAWQGVGHCSGRYASDWNAFLPPATKLGQGYIFTGVCDSVHGGVTAPGGCLLLGGVGV